MTEQPDDLDNDPGSPDSFAEAPDTPNDDPQSEQDLELYNGGVTNVNK